MELKTQVVQKIFYPLVVLAAVAIFVVFQQDFLGDKIVVLQLAIAVGAILVIRTSERLMPYHAPWNESKNDRVMNFVATNLGFPALVKLTELTLVSLIYSALGGRSMGLWQKLGLVHLHLVGQAALALVICEFFFYWIHRASHTVSFLWRMHAVHHRVPRVYWDNAGLFHPLDLFLNLLFYMAPLYIMGVDKVVVALFIVINTVTGLLEHANVDFEAGVLNRFFNTAELHRWHHSKEVDISQKNYGKVLSIWDQVFGTFYFPKDRKIYDVGVEE